MINKNGEVNEIPHENPCQLVPEDSVGSFISSDDTDRCTLECSDKDPATLGSSGEPVGARNV